MSEGGREREAQAKGSSTVWRAGKMRGWILDLYTDGPGKIVVWLKLEDGGVRRLVDRWMPSIFVASDSRADLADIGGDEGGSRWREFGVSGSRLVTRYERVTDRRETQVLELVVDDARKVAGLAERIERSKPFGTYRLYNVDVPPEQSYLYERDLFPLALCEVSERRDGLSWHLQDSIDFYDYDLPNLRSVEIEVSIKRSGKLARFSDPIESIALRESEPNGGRTYSGDARRERGWAMPSSSSPSSSSPSSEAAEILTLVEQIRRLDPDLIFTRGGDSFLLPYLVARAKANGISDKLSIDRDGSILELPPKKGTSYFSYGKILFKPSAMKLRGRVHLDESSSFVCRESGIEGFYEVSRVCRLPLHTASRASIGKALSSLQFYHATKGGILIPWKPALTERFKSRAELLIGDRGGFIFEPDLGVHEEVGELDFSSLYPSIMLKKNISAETVRCACCPDSSNTVPELGWNVCEKREGIVPKAVRVIVEKRLEYKRREKESAGRGEEEEEVKRALYASRRNALKWVGVATFGYLGFNNSKFGRIDAHMAVCAWDRKVLMDAARIAERRGFKVMHGIVDSLWLKKRGATEDHYHRLREEISEATGFDMAFEGIYKWIAFPPSKAGGTMPVLNRYFGAYKDGKLKVRGIEARRHDTPPLFSRCQMEVLKMLARADTVDGARESVDACLDIFLRHAGPLLDHQVPLRELAFTRNLSRKPGEYVNQSLTSCAADQLVREGVELYAGEPVRYVITDQRSGSAVPLDLADEKRMNYDAVRYAELLAEACSTVLEPFRRDCSAEGLSLLVGRSRHGDLR
jgi:DNA polymerase I